MADPQVFHFEGRIDTGVARNGDDWPGIFIRGDHSAGLADRLEYCIWGKSEEARRIVLTELIELLNSCQVKNG